MPREDPVIRALLPSSRKEGVAVMVVIMSAGRSFGRLRVRHVLAAIAANANVGLFGVP